MPLLSPVRRKANIAGPARGDKQQNLDKEPAPSARARGPLVPLTAGRRLAGLARFSALAARSRSRLDGLVQVLGVDADDVKVVCQFPCFCAEPQIRH